MQKRKILNLTGKLCLIVILLVLCFTIALPFIWMLSSSLKGDYDVFTFPIEWIPKQPKWENYVTIWTKFHLFGYLKNSVKLSVIVTLIQLFTSSFAAYAFAKIPFKGRNVLFLMYVATIAVPWQAYMVPQYMMLTKFGMVNSHLSLIVMHAFNVFGVFLLRQTMIGIPDELFEAGRIDGLNEYGLYFRIALPLSKTGLATLTIFTFVNEWNDFTGPLLYLTDDRLKTLQLGLRQFIQQYGSYYAQLMAASIVALIPVLIVFVLMQKHFIASVATSGLKG